MEGRPEPITPEARAAVERLLDSPTVATEEAAEASAIRFLLDGLEVESISELKRLVDDARADRYFDGFVAGVSAYAYSSSEPWAENGVQYVGTTGTTLRDAIAKARESWNYAG